MSLDRSDLDQLNEADLRSLIADLVPEGERIEYKREPYGNADADKKEFLKDVTSFANTLGGHLVLGMDASSGIATRLIGLNPHSVDPLKNRLESLLHTGIEPRVVGIRLKEVRLTDGTSVLVVRIPQSWHPPHRVSIANTNRFYLRNSGGVHEASVEELRTLFTQSAAAGERIRRFRDRRVELATNRLSAIATENDGRLFLHIVPLSAASRGGNIDLNEVVKLNHFFQPIGSDGWSPRFNIDGVANIRGEDKCIGYTQVFRDGSLEAVRAAIVKERDGKPFVPSGVSTTELIRAIPKYVQGLQALGVAPPLTILVTYQGLGGATFGHKLGWADEVPPPFPQIDPMHMPEIIVEEYGSAADYRIRLRPIFDTLWNAASQPYCTFLDKDGNWNVPSY
ncbi:MAG: ATP-binding protein [Bauldia sp.]|nr:ATP-binding protein [Bauldia sp.]